MADSSRRREEAARRKFIKQCVMGSCGVALGAYTAWDLFVEGGKAGLRLGFRNDAPEKLGQWSKEAEWYEVHGTGIAPQVHCTLCPHECVLAENDRGFCRTRVVKNQKLYTIAYGNPCSVHVDPIEKKPLNHFLPASSIFSIATAGCNLRCINCQNWEISQAKPDKTRNYNLPPSVLVATTKQRDITSIAYTYSDPIVFYEYVYDTAVLAREHDLRNVLVTAGYILPEPLRKFCKVVDAANVDLKGFSERFYKKVTEGKLAPVLKALEIMREEGVWIEITRLIVPTLSDDLNDIRDMAKWIVRTLGPDVPLHLSRFHPAYKLIALPLTQTGLLIKARETALDAGLHFVYIGNVPTQSAQDTICPQCGKTVIKRQGYHILFNRLQNGSCPCGEMIPGVWS